MYIRELIWNDYRIDHIERHDVEPDEVQEVCDDPAARAYRQGQKRYRVYGQTIDGRYLLVIVERLEDNCFEPITARDMTIGEKKNFRKRK